MPHFALFVEGKLSRLTKPNRMDTNKRIMDVAFKTEMSTFIENEREGPAFPSGAGAPILMSTKNPNSFYHNNSSSPPYMDIKGRVA